MFSAFTLLHYTCLMKHITLGIFAHVDAGKTTLSEALLYECGAIRNLGRVDNGSSFLDHDPLERQRGITIFSKQAVIQRDDLRIQLIDTPGHVDFVAETERTLSVLDYAVMVVDASSGVQSHTLSLWRLLKRHGVPTFVFVNKMDLAHQTRDEILKGIQRQLSEGCLDLTDGFIDELHEAAAALDEQAMAEYFDTEELCEQTWRRLVSQRIVFPCVFGSALKMQGPSRLLELLSSLADQRAWPQEFGVRVCKITHDSQGARLAWMRVTGGCLQSRDVLEGVDALGDAWSQKVNQIRSYSGQKFEQVQRVEAGGVCAVVGLEHVHAGDGLGMEQQGEPPLFQPVLSYRVVLGGLDAHKTYEALRILADEDPMLGIRWDERLQQINVQLMGAIQLEVLRQIANDRLGLDIDFADGGVMYKETIKNSVQGVGHFEPLRHYAEARLLLEPLPAGMGMQFGSTCSEDVLDRNWQRLIATHLVEREHVGVLTGSPITDMRITILSGRAHLKHTEGGDFRRSTYRAIRQGLMKAENVLLEPWYAFTLEVPHDLVGRAMADIQRMSGTFDAPVQDDDFAILSGYAPVSKMQNYALELSAYSHGKGRLQCLLDGYRACHNQDEVVQAYGYDPEADLDNTPDSVFCSHGAGYTVKWDQVDDAAHTTDHDGLPTPWRPIDARFFSTSA